MDRHQLAHLLAHSHPSMNPTRADARSAPANNLCHQSQSLSPRQKFQSHIRTLSQESTSHSRNASLAPYSPASSTCPSPTPSPTCNGYRYGDSARHGERHAQNEPQFITEEREAWARPSPSATQRGRIPPSEDAFVLQPPQDPSPVQQPRKYQRELRPFAPALQSPDINERPKTSRGSKFGFGLIPADHEDLQSTNSRFAEGSMTARSTGVSSTWLEHGSMSTISGDDSDDQSTPRASPQRLSTDHDEIKPTAVTPGTFKQRLARIGSAFKSNHHSNKPEADVQDAKKSKGLRKSMSLWNLHNIGGKSKDAGAQSILDLGSVTADPQKATPDHEVDVLNDRKRRAEVAYAQQFGSKKRKSNVVVAEPVPGPQQDEPSELRDDRTVTRRSTRSSVSTRRLSHSSSTMPMPDVEAPHTHGGVDLDKRPTRRELEKENQQLRAMLRQQETQSQKTPKATVERTRSSSAKQTAASLASSPTKQENKVPPKKKATTKPKAKDVPPVPSVPDRIVLQPLGNARNQPRNNNNANIVHIPCPDLKPTTTINNNNSAVTNSSNPPKRVTASVGVAAGGGGGGTPLPRPVSMILEEDEESLTENRTPSGKSPWRMEQDIARLKQLTPSPIRLLHPGKREQWEWPDDIF